MEPRKEEKVGEKADSDRFAQQPPVVSSLLLLQLLLLLPARPALPSGRSECSLVSIHHSSGVSLFLDLSTVTASTVGEGQEHNGTFGVGRGNSARQTDQGQFAQRVQISVSLLLGHRRWTDQTESVETKDLEKKTHSQSRLGIWMRPHCFCRPPTTVLESS